MGARRRDHGRASVHDNGHAQRINDLFLCCTRVLIAPSQANLTIHRIAGSRRQAMDLIRASWSSKCVDFALAWLRVKPLRQGLGAEILMWHSPIASPSNRTPLLLIFYALILRDRPNATPRPWSACLAWPLSCRVVGVIAARDVVSGSSDHGRLRRRPKTPRPERGGQEEARARLAVTLPSYVFPLLRR